MPNAICKGTCAQIAFTLVSPELESIIQDCLPEGFKRFEAIMASGIKGNELKF